MFDAVTGAFACGAENLGAVKSLLSVTGIDYTEASR
jgi:hypothetical protein